MLARLGFLRRPEDYLRGDAGTDLQGDVVLRREDARQRCAMVAVPVLAPIRTVPLKCSGWQVSSPVEMPRWQS